MALLAGVFQLPIQISNPRVMLFAVHCNDSTRLFLTMDFAAGNPRSRGLPIGRVPIRFPSLLRAPNPSSSSPITGARPDDSPAIARSPAPSRVSPAKLTPLFPFASSPQDLIDLAPTSAAPNPLRILPLLTAIIDSGRPSSPAPSLLLQLHIQADVHCYFNCVWLVPAAEDHIKMSEKNAESTKQNQNILVKHDNTISQSSILNSKGRFSWPAPAILVRFLKATEMLRSAILLPLNQSCRIVASHLISRRISTDGIPLPQTPSSSSSSQCEEQTVTGAPPEKEDQAHQQPRGSRRVLGPDYQAEQARVLQAALRHVVKLGWSEVALISGARDVGLSPSIVGSFTRKEAVLVEACHFPLCFNA
ncbi:hypothetical protein ACLOJK_028199 [Asimina triloba]